MSIIPTGGVIQFSYATIGGEKSAKRERRTVKGGTSSAMPAEQVKHFEILVDEWGIVGGDAAEGARAGVGRSVQPGRR